MKSLCSNSGDKVMMVGELLMCDQSRSLMSIRSIVSTISSLNSGVLLAISFSFSKKAFARLTTSVVVIAVIRGIMTEAAS